MIQSLWQRGCTLLGVETAIMGGAMTWVSERHLVAAISNAGAFGVLACGSMTPALLLEEIAATRALTNKPFGVNLILLHPQLDALLAACIEARVSHVVLAGGMPRVEYIAMLQQAGIKVIGFAPALPIARKLVRAGIDGLIIEGAEAGGHVGAVATSVLAQEILPEITEVPVFVAGGIGRGEAMLSYLEMGASGVQLGTRLVCAVESVAHPAFKQAFIRASARDAVVSTQLDARFPVIPVRALANEGTRRFHEYQADVIMRVDKGELDIKAGQLEIEHYWSGALRRAVVEGDIEYGSLMAGQSVGMVKDIQPVATILQEIMTQAETAAQRRFTGLAA